MSKSPSLKALWLEVRGIALPLLFGLIVATGFRTIAWQPFTIPSSSMSPGLLTGDYIVVSKFAYGWSKASLPGNQTPQGGERFLQRQPSRGDVVVFRLPRDPSQVWVKRVIGLPGDTVQMREGRLWVNDQPVSAREIGPTVDKDAPARPVLAIEETLDTGRRYTTYDGGSGLPGDDTLPLTVPAGSYLMMGDNRDNSVDGRWSAHSGVGFLPAANIVGRADLIAWSWKPGSSLFKPWTWGNLRGDRMFRPVR